MILNKTGFAAGVIAFALLLSGCGNDAATTAASSLSTSMSSLAVTSPTAARSASASGDRFILKNWFASIPSKLLDLFFRSSIAGTAPDTVVQPIGTMVSDMKSDIASSAPEAVAAKIGSMSVNSYRAPCYGPSWTDDATGSTVNRPSGDLGIVDVAAGPGDTMACAPAQLNSLVGGAPQFANKIVKLQATMIAGLRKGGKALPAIGASVDALADMPAITGITLSKAKLTRLANRASDGFSVFKTEFEFTDASSKTGSVTVYHTPLNDANTNYIGLLQAILPVTTTSNVAGHRGLSVVYQEVDGVIKYALDTAQNRSTDSTDFFSTTTGRVDFTKAAFGEDGNRIIASFNTVTNATTMHYAWQAGSNDGSVRAFAIDIPAGTEGSLTGVAYAGFGAAMTALTDDVSTPWMTKMYCNWLNGLANGTSVAKVQGQTFSQAATGKFSAVTSNIAFAPTDTCQKSGTFAVTNSQPDAFNGTKTVTAHSLVSVGAMGAISAVTVPSYPLP